MNRARALRLVGIGLLVEMRAASAVDQGGIRGRWRWDAILQRVTSTQAMSACARGRSSDNLQN
jgi:hypothetical protein